MVVKDLKKNKKDLKEEPEKGRVAQKLINEFISYLALEKRYSSETIRAYRSDLNQFADYLARAKLSIKKINPLILRRYLAYLHLRGKVQGGYVETTMARKVASLRAFLNYLAEKEVLPSSYEVFLPFPKLKRKLPEILSSSELEKLISLIKPGKPAAFRDRALIEVLLGAGLRVSELVSLNLNSLNFDRKEIRVKGKGGKERVVPLNKEAEEALTDYLSRARPLISRQPTEALFLNLRGSRLSAGGVRKILKKYAGKLFSKSRLHPHLFRHTLASGLLAGGADLRVVQEVLGHSSLSTTQIYLKLETSRLKKIYKKSHPRA